MKRECLCLGCLGGVHCGDSFDNLGVNGSRGGHNTLVLLEGAADAEIKSFSVDVGNLTAGLTYEQVSSCMIPDLLLVVRAGGETEVDVSSSSGNGAILGLGIKTDALVGDAEKSGDFSIVTLGRVAGLDTLAEAGIGNIGNRPHGDGLAGEECTVTKLAAGGTGALDSAEEHTGLDALGAGLANGRSESSVRDRQVRASNSSNLEIAVNDETKADGILLTTEKALCTVNGVKGPYSTLGTTSTLSAVKGVEEDLLAGHLATDKPVTLCVIETGFLNEFPDLAAKSLVLSEGASLLLGHDLVVREVLLDSLNDESLGPEVANCHWRGVIFGQGAFSLQLRDFLGEERRPLDCQLCYSQLLAV